MIKDLSHVPNKPGVYQFFDQTKIIYIGKAKDLKKRVRSYFTPAIKDRKTDQIKKQAIRVETFTTHSETEALILEQQLIKEYKPKFNILLRDDKTYPFIYFSNNHNFPSIYLKRSKQAVDSNFFGPYTSAKLVRIQIKEIQKIFKIRNCSNSTFSNRSRPCIEYQMKRCSAPCVNLISKSAYEEDIQSAKKYLTTEKKYIKKILKKKMEKHSENLEFEEAARYKTRLNNLISMQEESAINIHPLDIDIWHGTFSNSTGISKISVRDGKVRSTKTYFIKSEESSDIDKVFRRVIFHNYLHKHQLPPKLLIANKIQEKILLQDALTKTFNSKIRILTKVPKGGKSFLNLAKLNSKQVLVNSLKKEPVFKNAFAELSEKYSLPSKKLTLDCIDISHQSGAMPKGAVIRINEEGTDKKFYRAYSIPKSLGGDDTGSIKFTLNKRLKNDIEIPHIVLVDGGKLQLNAAQSIIGKKNILLLAIEKGAKRKRLMETVYSVDGKEEIDIKSDLFQMLTKARDEAHRFALSSSRAMKRAGIKKSILDSIDGIGIKKKALLLKRFKSIINISKASQAELMEINGISKQLAIKIKSYLSNR